MVFVLDHIGGDAGSFFLASGDEKQLNNHGGSKRASFMQQRQ